MGLISRLRERFAQPAAGASSPGTIEPAQIPPQQPPQTRSDSGAAYTAPPRLNLTGELDPVMLSGSTPVQVVGESYHLHAIRQAQEAQGIGSQLVAALVAEDNNPYDPSAIAVYLNGWHSGYLGRDVAAVVRPAVDRIAAANGGRPVGCLVEIREYELSPQVVLFLDVEQLGLRAELVEELPPTAKLLMRALGRLDDPQPIAMGPNQAARQLFDKADAYATRVEQMGRGHKRLADEYRQAAEALANVGDPLASRSWRSFASTVRYQSGRSGDAVEGYVSSVYYDRGNLKAWEALLDYASFLACVPVLLEIFKRAPAGIRLHVLDALLFVSRGHDRHGNLSPSEAPRLRDGILEVAQAVGDNRAISAIAGRYGVEAEKEGNIDAALEYWKQATDAGHICDLAADRYSIWLVKHQDFEEARRVLTQALAVHSATDAVRSRMEKRLARCNKPTM